MFIELYAMNNIFIAGQSLLYYRCNSDHHMYHVVLLLCANSATDYNISILLLTVSSIIRYFAT
ncbi:hypothetical protein V1478_005817 [Vespula squamosa]|uniref:Uncharacterized protein n=1 Tax=Vespula squamosa TaxID=30214 RepID=A0ABD2B9Y9_VESSQ